MGDPLTIACVYDNGGEEIGLYSAGHHDAEEFREAAMVGAPDLGLDVDVVAEMLLREVRHEWWRDEAGADGLDIIFRPAGPGEPGAYEVTCWPFDLDGVLAAPPAAPPTPSADPREGAAEGAPREGMPDPLPYDEEMIPLVNGFENAISTVARFPLSAGHAGAQVAARAALVQGIGRLRAALDAERLSNTNARQQLGEAREALAQERAAREKAEGERRDEHATLRRVAHALGVCYCWDYGCEPGPSDALLARVEELTSREDERIDYETVCAERDAALAALASEKARAEEAERRIVSLAASASGEGLRVMLDDLRAAERSLEEARQRMLEIADSIAHVAPCGAADLRALAAPEPGTERGDGG